MMEIFEVRYKFPDDTTPVMMEDCINNYLYETHRDVSENDKETNQYAMKMVIEEFPYGHDDDEKKKT